MNTAIAIILGLGLALLCGYQIYGLIKDIRNRKTKKVKSAETKEVVKAEDDKDKQN